MCVIQETIPLEEMLLMHLSYFLLQLELSGICFGISAFLRRNGMGIGLGIAIVMYFLNLMSNMTENTDFLKYITPFGYCETSEIINTKSLNFPLILLGIVYFIIAMILGFHKYSTKDIS